MICRRILRFVNFETAIGASPRNIVFAEALIVESLLGDLPPCDTSLR